MTIKNLIIASLLIAPHLLYAAHSLSTMKRLKEKCGVLIAGGSLTAVSAALTSARSGVKTCLLEPTNWAGGQLTNQGVSAIDEGWHSIDGISLRPYVYSLKNQNPEFAALAKAIANGKCWVGRSCGEAKVALRLIEEKLAREPNLKVFYNTVVKEIETESTSNQQKLRITKVFGIKRYSRNTRTAGIYFSDQVRDWYSPVSNSNFTKIIMEFSGMDQILPVIDASEFADVLVLSGADFKQGEDSTFDLPKINTCGQSTVFPFVASTNSSSTWAPPHPGLEFNFSDRGYSYAKIWAYRKIKETSSQSPYSKSLINWEQGNDYDSAYIFTDQDSIEREKLDWSGGLNLFAARAAENKAIAYYYHLRDKLYSELKMKVTMEQKDLGTTTGLSLMPYIRDTRRSVGLNNYELSFSEISSSALPVPRLPLVYDSIAIGTYPLDIHPLQNACDVSSLPTPPQTTSVRLYQIPLRAMTSKDVMNLIPAGKTMSQSFLVSSSTRIHPTEWNLGVAAGIMASYMNRRVIDSTLTLLSHTSDIVREVNLYQPTSWHLDEYQIQNYIEVNYER